MIFPLTGKLIDGKASYKWLADNSMNVDGVVSICSAFLRSSILEDFSKRLPKDSPVRVIARWRLEDLLAGASDLEAYEVCKKMGWGFYICNNFHGKVFSFPPNGILVGSANATESGLGLLSNSNSEVCTVVKESELNKQLVNSLFLSSTLMTDKLFEKMKLFYQESIVMKNQLEWPDYILKDLNQNIELNKLFLSECFLSNGDELILRSSCNSPEAKSDASLLSLPSGQFEHQMIANRFMKTKIYLLINAFLQVERQMYFGTLTDLIHKNLFQDPAPYRKDVKNIVKNIYSWINHLGGNYLPMLVDQPNHSERIRLI
jgi:hypothetical protein